MSSERPALDLIEELRLRRWARLNYVSAAERRADWDPVILNEMQLRDAEIAAVRDLSSAGERLVPLKETRTLRLDAAHTFAPKKRATPEPAIARSEFHFA